MQPKLTEIEESKWDESLEDWQLKKLKDLVEKRSRNVDPNDFDDKRYIGLAHIDSNKPRLREFGSSDEVKSNKYHFYPGDVLFGKLRPYLRKSVLVNHEGICSTDILVFKPNEKVDPEFVSYLMHLNDFVEYSVATMTGVNHPRTSWNALQKFEFKIPPLSEQRKIASILSTVQDAIAQTEAVIQATRELKKSMMKHLFIYGPVPVDQTDQVELEETDIGEINSNWSIGTLEDYTETRYGYTESAEEESIGPKYLRITDISDEGFIDWHSVPYCKINEEDLEKYKVKSGDIYVARIGATTGKTCYIEKERNAVFASYLIRLQVLDSDRLIPEYLYRFTQSKLYWDQLNAQKDGKLKKGISASALSNFKIPIPTLDTQKTIERRINTIENKLVNEINKKKSLEILFKSLLESLITAKIRVV